MIKIRSLQKKLIVFVVLPVAIILSVVGIAGFFYIRNGLYNQWQEIAVLQMARAAQRLETRLNNSLNLIEAFAQAGHEANAGEIQGWILKQLRNQKGIEVVRLFWQGSEKERVKVAQAAPPLYFFPEHANALGLRSDLFDNAGHRLGRIEVQITFSSLMQDLLASAWMQTNGACLLDDQGNLLAHVDNGKESRIFPPKEQDPIRLAVIKDIKEKPYGIISSRRQVIGFYRLKAAPLAIVLHAPNKQIITSVLHLGLIYPLAGILSLFLILLFIRMGVRPMVKSIQEISRKARHVAQGNYGSPLPVKSIDEIGQLTSSFNGMVAGLKERDFVTNTFGRYVDPEIAKRLLQQPEAARLGGKKREVVILFADICGFTPLAEGLSSEATIHLMNRFFSAMTEGVQQFHGIIVDFLGDAILAFFNPLDAPLLDTMRQAVRCALSMQPAMEKVNAPDGKIPVPFNSIGIGLHAGEVVVGNIGSENRAKYGVVGSAVNLASRIQNQARGGEVVISPAIYRLIYPDLAIEREFQTQLKGIQEPITLYAIQNFV